MVKSYQSRFSGSGAAQLNSAPTILLTPRSVGEDMHSRGLIVPGLIKYQVETVYCQVAHLDELLIKWYFENKINYGPSLILLLLLLFLFFFFFTSAFQILWD